MQKHSKTGSVFSENAAQTMIRYVIFDFDGTLADSKEAALTALNQIADRHRYKRIAPEALETLRKLPITERCKLLGWPVYKLPLLATELYGLYKKSIHTVKLFPGIREMLEALRENGYETAIISSNSEQNIREFLQASELPFIQHVICSNNIFGKDKSIKKFLKTHLLQPSEVLYVGDELRDLTACRKCRVKMIWVSWGFDSQELIRAENPEFMVHAPSEILQILPSNSGLEKSALNFLEVKRHHN
ncbi:HAD-IA family hydrolase [Adhaeribacter sp. BT258]|uniref:HAD-IA family hydrolase n=1 Tax=Adhaeribacter terrigena TaxID=2793070 RepID=A0ABS1C2T0_9BACT|nr:HAD-IA family hydrolase [Adhaeribacter terrigena]MBK0403477.1 HAD-IA family hydrolase [Adhaeribacter terrigena]